MRLTSNSNTIKSPRRRGAGRARTTAMDTASRQMFRPLVKSASGSVRFAWTINDPPPRSRVSTHNLGGIVRIEYVCTRRTQCRLAFRRPSSPLWFLAFPFPSSDDDNDRRGLLCLHDIAVPRLRIIDYRRVRWLIPRATWIRAARNVFRILFIVRVRRERICVFARLERVATFPSLFNNTVIVCAPAAGYTAGHDFLHDQKGKVSAARNTRKITRKIRGWFPMTVKNLCLSCIKIARNY